MPSRQGRIASRCIDGLQTRFLAAAAAALLLDKFEGADSDRNKALTPAEFAVTAPKPKKPKPACSCG
jgi:hypothetical protein